VDWGRRSGITRVEGLDPGTPGQNEESHVLEVGMMRTREEIAVALSAVGCVNHDVRLLESVALVLDEDERIKQAIFGTHTFYAREWREGLKILILTPIRIITSQVWLDKNSEAQSHSYYWGYCIHSNYFQTPQDQASIV
jgi:hypothetical protein